MTVNSTATSANNKRIPNLNLTSNKDNLRAASKMQISNSNSNREIKRLINQLIQWINLQSAIGIATRIRTRSTISNRAQAKYGS